MKIFEIILIIISIVESLYAIGIFIYSIKNYNKEEKKNIFLKPSSVFIISTLVLSSIYYTNIDTFIEVELIMHAMIGITLIIISRKITIFILKFKTKILHSIIAIIFGIGTFGIFLIILDILDSTQLNKGYQTSYQGYFYLFQAISIAVISISLNIGEIISVLLKKGVK